VTSRQRSGLRAGSGILLSDNLAYRLGLHRGDDLTVPTAAGPRRFRIEGTYVDYLGSLDLGAVAVAYPELARMWGDRSVNLLRVWLASGASQAAVRDAILARLGSDQGYYVLTAGQFLDAIRAQIRAFFLATWALQLIAAVVGVVGVVNAQLASILDRSTEIAVLRTIGFATRDLTRSVLIECAALGALGAASGVAIGAMVSADRDGRAPPRHGVAHSVHAVRGSSCGRRRDRRPRFRARGLGACAGGGARHGLAGERGLTARDCITNG